MALLPDGSFCPTAQPAYSAQRSMTYGHGELTLLNATHAEWKYYSVLDAPGQPADSVTLQRNPACPFGSALPTAAAAPGPAAAPTSTGYVPLAATALALLVAAAAAFFG